MEGGQTQADGGDIAADLEEGILLDDTAESGKSGSSDHWNHFSGQLEFMAAIGIDLRSSPAAKLSDGFMDLFFLRSMQRPCMLSYLLPTLALKRFPSNDRSFAFHKVQAFSLIPGRPKDYWNVDGNPRQCARMDCVIRPGLCRVFISPEAEHLRATGQFTL